MGTYSAAVLADNPVVYWRLGEKSGTVAKHATATTGRDGTYFNTPTLGAAGAVDDGDSSVYFGGVGPNGYVRSASYVWNAASASVECWVRLGSLGTDRFIVGGHASPSFDKFLYVETTGGLRFSVYDTVAAAQKDTPDPTTKLPVGEWVHCVGTIDGTTARCYMNGVEVGNVACGPSLNTYAAANVAVGQTMTGHAYFHGQIDEVAVYATALTATKVGNHYAAAGRYAGAEIWRQESSLAAELSLDPSVSGFAPFQAAPANGPTVLANDVANPGNAWATPTNATSENAVTTNATLGGVGQSYAGTASGSGWNSPSQATGIENDVFANYETYAGGTTALIASNFGFAIPATAVIEQVWVAVKAMAAKTGSGEGTNSTQASYVALRAGGAAGPNYSNGTIYTTPAWNQRNLTKTDWGFSGLTPAQVNASTFGFQFTASFDWSNAVETWVDSMWIAVIYSNDSQYLKATSFGFAVPGTATIDGISARVRRKTTADPTVGGSAWDRSVKLVKGGTVQGDDKMSPTPGWPTVLADKTYGGAGDKWGLTWVPADVNAANFGVAIAAYYRGTAEIDYVELTIYYTDAGVSVATVGQPKIRFGPEEADAGQVLIGTSFSTEMPGGFSAGNFVVQRSEYFDPANYLYASGRLLEYETGRVLHEGRVVGISETAEGEVSFELEGWGKALGDNKTAREIFIDRDTSSWRGMSVARKLYVISPAGATPHDGSTATDVSTGAPAVELTMEDNAFTVVPYIEMWYDANGLEIGVIDWVYKTVNINTGITQWQWYLGTMIDDVSGGGGTATANLRTIGVASSNTLTVPAGSKFAYVQLIWGGANTGGTGKKYSVFWTYLGVVGRHGLTLRGTLAAPADGRGLYGSDVIGYVIEQWADRTAVPPTGVLEVGEIEPTTFVIPHLVFKEPTTPLAMIEAVCALGSDDKFFPLDWFVYEGRRLDVADPTRHGTTWRVRYSEGVEATDSGPDVSAMLNGVMVQYDDGTGSSSQTVGPPGSGATLESALLVDTGDSNPANRDGSKHWEVFSAGITSQQGAIRIGQVILADRNRQEWRGEVSIKRRVRDSAGNVFPAALVRAGDYIVIEDDEDTRPRRIVNTTCDATSQTVTCSIGAEPDRHDVFLAKAGIVLEAQL